jgi:hypothetical protein
MKNNNNNFPSYNLDTESVKSLKQFHSFLEKQTKSKLLHKDLSTKLQSFLTKLANDVGITDLTTPFEPAPVVNDKPSNANNIYEKAFNTLYNKQPDWRKQEIDRAKINGTFGTKDWDQDFIHQVAVLAEENE